VNGEVLALAPFDVVATPGEVVNRPAVHQDVRGLEVAMDDVVLVGMGDGVADAGQGTRPRERISLAGGCAPVRTRTNRPWRLPSLSRAGVLLLEVAGNPYLPPMLTTAALAVLAAPLVSPTTPALQEAVETAPRYEDEWYLRASDGACSLLVREYGSGPPVVVVHGGWGAEHSYLLDAIWPHRQERRFVMYDQRGSLRSPAASASITLSRHIEDLEDLRGELGLERLTLLAHSMGTFLALAYAERHPQHVEKLVLTAAVPPVFDGADSPNALWSENAKLLMERPEVQEILEREGLTGPSLGDREATHAWRIRFASVNLSYPERWAQLRGGRVFYSQASANAVLPSVPATWDFTPLFSVVPIHVVIGDEDYVDPAAETWRSVDPGDSSLRIEVLERAGHALWIDQPVAFRDALRRSLGSSSSSEER
jgi:proline iminopeptidase